MAVDSDIGRSNAPEVNVHVILLLVLIFNEQLFDRREIQVRKTLKLEISWEEAVGIGGGGHDEENRAQDQILARDLLWVVGSGVLVGLGDFEERLFDGLAVIAVVHSEEYEHVIVPRELVHVLRELFFLKDHNTIRIVHSLGQ